MIWFASTFALISLVPSAWLGLREHAAFRFAAERGIMGHNEFNMIYKCWIIYFKRKHWDSPQFVYSGLRGVARNVVKSTSVMIFISLYQGYFFYDLYRIAFKNMQNANLFGISRYDALSIFMDMAALLTIIGTGFSFTSSLVRDINNATATFDGADTSSATSSVSDSLRRIMVTGNEKTVSQLDNGMKHELSDLEQKEQAQRFLNEIGVIDENGKPNYEARNTRVTRHLSISDLQKGLK